MRSRSAGFGLDEEAPTTAILCQIMGGLVEPRDLGLIRRSRETGKIAPFSERCSSFPS